LGKLFVESHRKPSAESLYPAAVYYGYYSAPAAIFNPDLAFNHRNSICLVVIKMAIGKVSVREFNIYAHFDFR
jgi:hypothetical protein